MRTPGEQPPAGGGSGGRGPESAGPDPDEVGRLLAGRYRVTGRIGRGGMGTVWRAVDEVLGREVAVKELRTFTDAGPGELAEMRTRMQREARAAARVRHAGVVAVHDVAQHDDRPIIVMELIEGPSLDDMMRERGTVTPQEAAAIGAKVMDALAAAHRAGVLHRDVKPGNVLLESGSDRVVLTDFGIAAVEDPDDGASTRLTGSGELVGSLDYLAPERARGEAPSAACDVWALGATLYAAVEGSVPFRRTSTWSTLNAIVVEALPEPVRAGPLGPVLAELMEKDPAVRADAERAKTLLEAVAQGAAPPPGPSSTMRLGKPERLREQGQGQGHREGQYGHAPQQSGHPGPQDGPGAHPARFPDHVYEGAAAPPDPAARKRGGTDRHTVRTMSHRADGRRRVLVVAAVAAVVLTGAGATFAAVSGPAEDGPRAGGSSGNGATAGAGKPGGGKGGDSVPEKDGRTGRAIAGPGSEPGPTSGGSAGRDGGKDAGATEGDTSGGAASGSGGQGDSSGAGGGGSSTGGGGAPAPKPACNARGGGKYNCTVWKTATSYSAAHKPVGRLNAGTNYFFCQKKLPHRESSGRWTNVWWAKTDDDKGNKGVFVSDVYIKGGANNRPVPGLPVC